MASRTAADPEGMEVADMKTANKVSQDLMLQLMGGGRVFDESAETCLELAERLGISGCTALRRIRKLLKDGKLERVWKKGLTGPVPAYRVKK